MVTTWFICRTWENKQHSTTSKRQKSWWKALSKAEPHFHKWTTFWLSCHAKSGYKRQDFQFEETESICERIILCIMIIFFTFWTWNSRRCDHDVKTVEMPSRTWRDLGPTTSTWAPEVGSRLLWAPSRSHLTSRCLC